MHKLSVGVFTQFPGSLSGLLDHAALYAEARRIDPSSRRTFWEHQVKRQKMTALHFAGVIAGQFRRSASSGHLTFELLKSLPCIAFAIINEPDRGLLSQWPADDRRRILANRLVDEVFVMIPAANPPFEAD